MKLSRAERAYKYINMRANGGKTADFFDINEPVLIYGFTDLARVLYEEIHDKVNFLGFIDTKGGGEVYKSTNVYFLQQNELAEKVVVFDKVTIVVMPTWDFDNIHQICNYWLPCHVRLIPADEIFVLENLKKCEDRCSKSYLDVFDDLVHGIPCDKELYIGGTAYMTLLFILMKRNWKDSIYVLQDDYTVDIFKKMKNYNLAAVLTYDESAYNVSAFDSVRVLVDYYNSINRDIYGDDASAARYTYKKEIFNVIEDGIINYRFKHCCNVRNRANGDVYYGFDPKIKHVYITGRLPVPKQIQGREVLIDLMKAWQRKLEKEKEMILDIFSFPQKEIEGLMRDGYDKIFLTDKMTRNNWVSESDQIDMCREVLSKYDKNVIIKPHPADLVDYTKYFPEYPVLYGKFPVDFVGLQQMKIKKIISFFSTACFGNTVFSDEQADMYPEIMERYGIKTVQQELEL